MLPILLALLAVSDLRATVTAIAQGPTERLTAHVHESEIHDGKLPYRLFTPQDTDTTDEQKLPLVLFLHGAGERGDDNRRQLVHGVRDFVSAAAQQRRPCFVVAPQCPRGVWWHTGERLPMCIELVESLLERHPIDPDRVYVTGLSMGGYGTWHVIARRPDLFAAAIPICGGGEPAAAAKIAHLPIWAFHGDADSRVPPQQSRAMIEALREAGGEPNYTEYEGVGHNSWARTYSDRDVHEWLFAQRRAREVAPPRLEKGDRVVFFGDSITQAGASREHGYVNLVAAGLASRHPDLEIDVVGAGIGGHKVPDLQGRVDRDVVAKEPDVVVIYIGINDVWHWSRDRGTEKGDFEAGLRDLIARIGTAGARVILCTPSVIGEMTDGSNRFDPMLEEYAAIGRQVARDTGTQLLDLRRAFLDWLKEHNPDNAEKGILTTDGVHLTRDGDRFVADRMLEALGAGLR